MTYLRKDDFPTLGLPTTPMTRECLLDDDDDDEDDVMIVVGNDA